ncbi:MAG: hypothetical protein KR126chlam4_00840 [Candidatus Anoxychlamydiales bacterium]|nr:hypothetical protein [Candidatus Anoxychlamydiales bacterium]HEU64696.1 hypothetical protein [Chlamydiota bacterium]
MSYLNPLNWFGSKPAIASTAPAASATAASSTTTASGIGSTATTMAPASSPASSTTPSSDPANIYVEVFKECFTKPDETVLKHPIKSLTYHVAIKILFYSIAQSFPVFGWAAIAFSAALFDRVVLLNLKKYPNAILDSLKDAWKYISDKWSKAKPPAPASSAAGAPPAPPASSLGVVPPATPVATSTTGTS